MNSSSMSDKNPEFTLIIPAYNEAEGLPDVLKKIDPDIAVIVVDDGSTDDTAAVAEKNGVRVIRHSANIGYGRALKTGIKHADTPLVVITDADGTYPNDMIETLIEKFHQGNHDMVVGARTKANAAIPLIRRPAKWALNKLANFLTKTTIPDLNSGLRVMRKDVVEKYFNILPDGFSFTTTITIAMICGGYSVSYLPIEYFKRTGSSKIKPIQDTINFITLILRTIIYFHPLRVFVPISLLILLVSVVLILFQAISYRNISDLSILIFFSGLQIMAIGLIADLIGRKCEKDDD